MKNFFLALVIFFFAGCGTLGLLVDESGDLSLTDVRPTVTLLEELAGSLVPPPYNIPAALAAGYLLALGRRIYKKKKGCQS